MKRWDSKMGRMSEHGQYTDIPLFRARYPFRKSLKKWRAQGDDFRTFLAEFASNLPHAEHLAELSL
jgi:hypothetical protein